MAEERKLVKKLAEVMDRVKYIQKKGFNKFHNYSYATEADVNESIREELSKRHIIMIPDVKSCSHREHTNRRQQIEYITTVEMEFTFIDGETGEKITFSSYGEGQDAGDKGVYKAITGAQKYALMKAFMIPTGDDPEGDNGTDERNNQEQSQPNQRKQEPDKPPTTLRTKYKLGKGDMEGFEEWVAGQKEKGFNYEQMERALTVALQNKNGEQKGA